jgi:tetratricopeptide (TPR) repeat protein
MTLLGLLALIVAAPGCGVINKLRAKDSLNAGVRLFNQGKIDQAQQQFERALELSPDLANAQLFHARALNARFDQNRTEELGLKTIQAYDTIINNSKDDPQALDRALAFKAKVYDDLATVNPDKAEEYKQQHRDAVLARAELPSATDQTRADVYYTIGHGYWEEAYNMSRPFTYADGSLRQELPKEVSDKMRVLVQKGHEFFQRAIAKQPEYANAYFYEGLTNLQESYIEKDPARKKKLLDEIPKYREKYIQLNKQQQANAQAAQ